MCIHRVVLDPEQKQIRAIVMSGKTAGVRIRIEPGLHDAFASTCQAQDRKASEVLRDFMRSYVKQHAEGKQQSLFLAPGDDDHAAH